MREQSNKGLLFFGIIATLWSASSGVRGLMHTLNTAYHVEPRPTWNVVISLQRLGLAVGTMHLISVPGRKSGKLRTKPVSTLTVDGRRYIVAGLDQADWVKNVRVAGWGVLARGCKEERVTLVELPIE